MLSMGNLNFLDQRERGWCEECEEDVICVIDINTGGYICKDCGSWKVEV
jgi:Zn finger protein HypA/HybF involved in hydrogenase expression